MIFSFGESENERIEIDVHGYERPAVGDSDDDNWLSVMISVKAGGFRGKAGASFITSELSAFLDELCVLLETLKGSAEFTTMEEQLSLHLEGDGKGHIELRGEVRDESGFRNRLHFTLQFDQSQLSASIRELRKVVLAFPTRTS
jgi:hypothetical protein